MTSTGHTAIEKIMGRAAARTDLAAGQTVECEIDMTVLIDFQFREFNQWVEPLKIADPARVAVILDHGVPAPSPEDAEAHSRARRFVERFGIRQFFDVGHHGICHQVVAEKALARPGTMLVCADSHTCAGGAFNCAARGLGPLEVLQVLCTGSTWFSVPETVAFALKGHLGSWVTAKDLFLHLAERHSEVTANRALEFAGPGLSNLDMHERRVLATQGIELMADFALFPCDEVTSGHLADAGFRDSAPLWSDVGAVFAEEIEVDMSTVEPYVGLPGGVIHNVAPISEMDRIHVEQCFIGSCSNGQNDDLAVAAAVLEGKKVRAGTRLIVTPASQAVMLEAIKKGHIEALVEAGAVITPPGCGACPGYHLGVLGPGENCISASTRNFKGRMGSPSANVYLASPATVAASAVTGYITDPRQIAD